MILRNTLDMGHAPRKARTTLCIFLVFLIGGLAAVAETIDGFITNVASSIQFDVGKMRVELNNHTECDRGLVYGIAVDPSMGSIPRPSAWYLLRPGHHYFRFDSVRTQRVPCNAVHLTVGSHVHLTGTQASASTFAASSVLVYAIQRSNSLHGSAVLEEDPTRAASQNSREPVWIDGYKLDLAPSTKFQSLPGEQSADRDHLRAGMQVIYKASRARSGSLMAESIQMTENQRTPFEGNFLKLFAATIAPPDYSRRVPGTIHFTDGASVSIVPDRLVQDFVSRLGMELVPEYQKLLSDDDASKVSFRFLVVRSSSPAKEPDFMTINGTLPHQDPYWGYDYPHSTERMKQVIALPTGLVLIPDVALANLDNKAHLAALLSYGITAILQKDVDDAWRTARSKNLQDRANLFQEFLSLNERVLRVGIRQMYLAGYDIREAPWAWDLALGQSAKNPTAGGPSKLIKPWYAAYAFNYISHYYKDVDYSKLRRGRAEYAKFLIELCKADPGLPHSKARR